MDERFTNFYVDYNLEDTTASTDATFISDDSQQYFTNITLLKSLNEDLSLDRFTFEHNFNILDGSKTEMENNSDNEYNFQNNSSTINSIVFVERLAGTITANSSSEVAHQIAIYSKTIKLSEGLHYLSGCPKNGSSDTYYIKATINGNDYIDIGEGTSFTLSATTFITISCTIAENYIANDIIFKPVVSMTEGPYVPIIVPYFNSVLSNLNGQYEVPQGIVITFTREHSSVGFVMQFLDDHPLEVEFTFYNLENSIITKFAWDIVSNKTVITKDVEFYSKIVIKFTKTAPGRYIKWYNFRFGVWLTWDETNVRDGSIVQQVDRLSKNLSIDTLSFTVIDVTNTLNLGNTSGLHRYFQRSQYMLPKEVISYSNGEQVTINLGKYYLKTFSESSNLGKMTLQSYLGFLDDVDFYEGRVYNGELAGVILDEIFAVANCTNYTIDAETYNTKLYGTITPKSCRKAITEILFACNSVINAHDMDNIIIKKTENVRRPDISKNMKFSTSVTKNDYTYGIEIKYTSYVKDTETKEIAKGTYEAGTHTIYFTQPYETLSINVGTIDEQNTYYVIFTIQEEAEVIITGYAFTTTTNITKFVQSKLKAGEGETIKSFSTTLCNSKTALELAKKILDYYTYDLTVKIKSLATDNIMEDLHIIQNPVEGFNDYYGMYTKRSLDLTGGFVDTAELYGTYIQDSNYQFTKPVTEQIELYSGGEVLI